MHEKFVVRRGDTARWEPFDKAQNSFGSWNGHYEQSYEEVEPTTFGVVLGDEENVKEYVQIVQNTAAEEG
jgi:hypothetical protein